MTKSGEAYTLPEIMDMDVRTALSACKDWKLVSQRLNVLNSLGLGYLTLGEPTPALSGGEAQRLKLASEMGKAQSGSVFVFDEPTIGLHPLDVQTLLTVFQTLIESGATVIVIEHDLDVIRSADYILDMGPGGGEAGGRLVAGTDQKRRGQRDRKIYLNQARVPTTPCDARAFFIRRMLFAAFAALFSQGARHSCGKCSAFLRPRAAQAVAGP